MNRKPVICLIVVLVIGTAWLALRPRAPMYQGKSLGVWLTSYDTLGGPSPEKQQADDAVRDAGTNAIPTLLRLLRARDSALTLKLQALARRQRMIKFKFLPAGEKNFAAAVGFRVLGASAREAAPALIKIYDRNISYPSQLYAIDSLGAIGPAASNAVPALLRATANPNWVVRVEAVEALGKIHADPARVVPVLIKSLDDPEVATRQRAIVALGEYGADARPAAAALIKASKDSEVQSLADQALKAIDSNTASPALVK